MEVLTLAQQKEAVLFAPKDLLWKILDEEEAWLQILGVLPEEYYNQFLVKLRLLGVEDANQIRNMAKVYVRNKVHADHLQEAVAVSWHPTNLEEATSWLKENEFLERPLGPMNLTAEVPSKEKIYVSKSPIHGEGTFASSPIKAGTELPAFTKKGEGSKDADWTRTDLGRYINHSSSPNTEPKREGNAVFLVPVKDVSAGEELTVNYESMERSIKQEPDKQAAVTYSSDLDMPMATRLRLARAAEGMKPKVGHPPDGASAEALKCWNKVLRCPKRRRMIYAPVGIHDQWAMAHKFWLQECAQEKVPAYKSRASSSSSSLHATTSLHRSMQEMHNSLCYDGYTMSRPAARTLRKLYDQLVVDGYELGPWNAIRPKTPRGI